jgi:UDP-N-acetylmuramoylalanine--D-glutamate ligase
MKIAILGYDVEGRASYDYFAAQGDYELTILDQNIEVEAPAGVESVLGENYLDNLDRFDLIVRTAGLQPRKILEKNPGIEPKITSQLNEFMKVCPTQNIIGITGTKGKGTTSTLVAKMLEADGKYVYLGGNIGTPPLTFLDKLGADSWVVLELSSFQLIDLRMSPRIAVCLMVTPEHLDWHPDINEYTTAKSQLFAHQTEEDTAIFLAGNELSKLIAGAGQGRKLPYFAPPGAYVDNDAIVIAERPVCYTTDLKLLGKHNWQNACAAITAAWQVTQNVEVFRSVLTSFTGLPHRLEMVRELDGVRYYDDSFGTAPETTMVAVEALSEPKILILGGRGKGIPFDDLAKFVAGNGSIKSVVTVGETGPEIADKLRQNGFQNIIDGGKSIEEIVELAREQAKSGDVVLLSTACTSFDMFKNYKERGEKFTAAVRALA